MFKEAIAELKKCNRCGREITELCIHMETPAGEILQLDIDLDETGDLIMEYNKFANEINFLVVRDLT